MKWDKKQKIGGSISEKDFNRSSLGFNGRRMGLQDYWIEDCGGRMCLLGTWIQSYYKSGNKNTILSLARTT